MALGKELREAIEKAKAAWGTDDASTMPLHQMIARSQQSGNHALVNEYTKALTENRFLLPGFPVVVTDFQGSYTDKERSEFLGSAINGVWIIDNMAKDHADSDIQRRLLVNVWNALRRSDIIVLMVGDADYLRNLRVKEPTFAKYFPHIVETTPLSAEEIRRENNSRAWKDLPFNAATRRNIVAPEKAQFRMKPVKNTLE